jgi:hypothetical protein
MEIIAASQQSVSFRSDKLRTMAHLYKMMELAE